MHSPHKRATRLVQQLTQRATSSQDAAVEFVSPLECERASPSFPVRKLTYYLDGGKAVTGVKELVATSMEEDPVLVDHSKFDASREEARRRTMAKISQVVSVMRSGNDGEDTSRPPPTSDEDRSGSRAGGGKTFEDAFYGTLGTLDPSWAIRIGVHYGLFQSAINGSGTDAQRAKYSRDVQEMRIIGCFAMTEMGHGSFLQGLETTATFDASTQEFVVHSPTVTATKWWIGMAGQTATHAAVFAKLIVGDQMHGIQTFIVPLRSLETGETVPDVEVGDMGSKMGRNGLDNGWIRFNHKRVPRDAMLMRWAQVDEKGHFTPPPSKQIAYNSLIGTRVELFKHCAEELKKALCISIRYALVRKQFLRKDDPSGKLGETKLLDYPTHQARLFPILAHAYVLHFSARRMQRMCDSSFADLESNLASLPQLHATSSGLKAIGTWYTNDALESARQSLGGMGYSSYSVLPSMRADYAVMCSWEGDNTVLSLQCARFLVKQCVALQQQKVAPTGVTSYLATIDLNERCAAGLTDEQMLEPSFQLRAFQHRSARRIKNLTALIANEAAEGHVSYAVASERHSAECMVVTRLHGYTFLLECMQDAVAQAPKELKPVLKIVCDLFALHDLQEHLVDLLESGFFTSVHAAQVRRLVRVLLGRLRPHALPLVDAFNLPDFVVDSPLGRFDGDVYRTLFEQIKAAPGGQGETPAYFQELIRPLTDKNFKPQE